MAWMKTHEAIAKLPEVLMRGRFSFLFNEVPLVVERLSLRQTVNLLNLGLAKITRSNRVRALPASIHIEPTNICDLQCPLCPSGRRSMKRELGFMAMQTFQRILDELGDALIFAVLYGWGEPFLHKECPRMIEACARRNIATIVSTNGHCLQSLDEALRVVDAGLSVLMIALDGSTQEIYDTYRKGGDVEKVKRCTSLIEKAKAIRGSELPYTNLRVVVTRHNEVDLPNIETLAQDLGVNMLSYKSLWPLTRVEDRANYEPIRREMHRFEYIGSSRRKKPLVRCPYPFRSSTIFWDGTVVGCQFDYDLEKPLGKLGEQPFEKIWNGVQSVELRRAIRSGENRPMFCQNCPYQDQAQKGCVLSSIEFRPLGPRHGSVTR
jgi:radical SAM protein with 4Fe4S-binding SPASM domain